jgi:hypothetical protein
VPLGQRAVGVAHELAQLLDEVVSHERTARTTQGQRRDHVGPWRAPDTEVDAPRMQRFEQAVRLGHFERRVVG